MGIAVAATYWCYLRHVVNDTVPTTFTCLLPERSLSWLGISEVAHVLRKVGLFSHRKLHETQLTHRGGNRFAFATAAIWTFRRIAFLTKGDALIDDEDEFAG